MAWSNMEVESVELVQDMSYDVLLDKLLEENKRAGMQAVYKEVISNFSIAMQSVENCKNNFSAFLLQSEETLCILISSLFAFIKMLEMILGYKVLASSVLDRIEQVYNKSDYSVISKLIISCEELVQEEIDNQMFWGDVDSLKKADLLSYYTGKGNRESAFKIFTDCLLKLILIIDDKMKHHCGKSDRSLLCSAVSNSIAYYANAMNNDKYIMASYLVATVGQIVDTVCLRSNKDKAEHPFVYVLNQILNK